MRLLNNLKIKRELGGVSVQTITPDHSSRDIFLFLSKFEKGNIFWKMIGYIYKSLIMDNQIYKISKSLPSGAFSLGGNFKKYIKKNNFYYVDLLECTSLCFRTKILKKIGGFNNFYKGTSEYHEAEACAKVRQQNYKLGLSTHSFLYHNTSKKGVYSARYNTYERLENFIFYYFNNVFEIKLKFLIQFISYIIFQICYGFFNTY